MGQLGAAQYDKLGKGRRPPSTGGLGRPHELLPIQLKPHT